MDKDYSLILIYCYPGKVWYMADNDYDTLDWMDESEKPTKAELDALWATTQNKIKVEQDKIAETAKSLELKLQKLGLTVEELKSLLSSN